jgi:hypothetical protein
MRGGGDKTHVGYYRYYTDFNTWSNTDYKQYTTA